jgi:hypothetical protein
MVFCDKGEEKKYKSTRLVAKLEELPGTPLLRSAFMLAGDLYLTRKNMVHS